MYRIINQYTPGKNASTPSTKDSDRAIITDLKDDIESARDFLDEFVRVHNRKGLLPYQVEERFLNQMRQMSTHLEMILMYLRPHQDARNAEVKFEGLAMMYGEWSVEAAMVLKDGKDTRMSLFIQTLKNPVAQDESSRSVQHTQLFIDGDKFLAISLFNVARNLSTTFSNNRC